MILAAVGKNGTGKDFFLDYVAQKYGFPMISIGDVVRELATKDGLELTRDNLHATSKKYMGEFGQTFFPEMIVKKIKESDAPNYLVSGIRPPSDIEIFRKAFGDDFILVDVVISDDEVRYQRMIARGSATARALRSSARTLSTRRRYSTPARARRWQTMSSRTTAAWRTSTRQSTTSMRLFSSRKSAE